MDESDPSLATDLRELLVALIEAALLQEGEHAGQALATAAARLASFQASSAGGSPVAPGLAGAWTRAVRAAETPSFAEETLRVSLTLPAACPLAPEELTDPTLDAADLAERVRLSAGTG